MTFNKKRPVVGLEFNEQWIKLALLEKGQNGRAVMNLAAKRCPQGSDEARLPRTKNGGQAVASAIRELFEKLKLKNPFLITSIPRYLSSVRFLRLPSSSETEIGQILALQSKKYIPYGKEQMVVHYQLVDIDRQGYSEVMLVVVRKEIIKKHLKILEQAGLSVQKIMFGSEALFNSYLAACPASSAGSRQGVLSALVDIDYSARHNRPIIEIGFVNEGRLVFTRGIVLKQAEGSENSWIIQELRRSFSAYQGQNKELKLEKIILLGSAVKPDGLEKGLYEEFSAPVESIDILEKIPLKRIINLAEEFKTGGLSPATVVGLVLNNCEKRLNFLPEELKERQRSLSWRRSLIKTGLALLLIAFTLYGVSAKKFSQQQRHSEWLKTELERTNPEAARIRSLMEHTALIKKQIDTKGSSLKILRELHRIMPPQISLIELAFEYGLSLRLKGASFNMPDVTNFVGLLEKSPYFEKVELKYVANKKVEGKQLTDFQIFCSLKKIASR